MLEAELPTPATVDTGCLDHLCVFASLMEAGLDQNHFVVSIVIFTVTDRRINEHTLISLGAHSRQRAK